MLSLRSSAFCDFVTITTPKEDFETVLGLLTPYFDSMGCTFDDSAGGYRPPSGGLFRIRADAYGISIFTSSGGFNSALRDHKLLACFFSEFSKVPHNVSSADLTVDEYVPAPQRLHDIYSLAATGQVAFTRKALTLRNINRLMRPALYGSTLFETGTVYLGKRGKNEIHAKVYDKRNEILDKTGNDSPDTLRHEMTVSSKMGISLRDIVEPERCFYHFYPENLLSRAEKVPWVGWGQGFSVERPESKLPAQKLAYRVETSTDLANLLKLADAIGENGLGYLLNQICKQAKRLDKSKPALRAQLVPL